MKKTLISLVALALTLSACSNDVSVTSLGQIYPGMDCVEMENYLKTNKLEFKKDGDKYTFEIDGPAWRKATVTCNKNVTEMVFDSESGNGPKYAKAYIDAQQSLMEAFRGNMITYEEGNRIINMNNGIRLRQFMDGKKGVITHFEIIVANMEGALAAWKKVVPLLPKIGAGK